MKEKKIIKITFNDVFLIPALPSYEINEVKEKKNKTKNKNDK
ncbi:MAG: hypothetical protein ABIH65_03980 [Nanoarchaeota archaeon]